MADDTRVTHSRQGFACAVALFLPLIGCALPAAAERRIIVRRDPGLSAARARRRARGRRRALERDAAAARTPSWSARPTRTARCARLARDPACASRAPNVAFHVARPTTRRGPPSGRSTPEHGRQRRAGVAESREGAGVTVARRRHGRRRQPPRPRSGRSAPTASTTSHDGGQHAATTAATTAPHVAGMIAARRDNGKGIAGIAPLGADPAAAGDRQLRRRQPRRRSWRRSTRPASAASRSSRPPSAPTRTLPDPAVAQAIANALAADPEHALRRRRRQRGPNDNRRAAVYPCNIDARRT